MVFLNAAACGAMTGDLESEPFRNRNSGISTLKSLKTILVSVMAGCASCAWLHAAEIEAQVWPVVKEKNKKRENPMEQNPTYADVRYGEHERNVMDVWLAKSDTPTPCVMMIHGGGWLGGD
ncbi:MAG: hypothetical protein WCP55_24890, partial [Lentisphaerota bacterium]